MNSTRCGVSKMNSSVFSSHPSWPLQPKLGFSKVTRTTHGKVMTVASYEASIVRPPATTTREELHCGILKTPTLRVVNQYDSSQTSIIVSTLALLAKSRSASTQTDGCSTQRRTSFTESNNSTRIWQGTSTGLKARCQERDRLQPRFE